MKYRLAAPAAAATIAGTLLLGHQAMPFQELLDQIASGELRVQIGKVFHLDQIVEAHWLMEENKAGGKIVVLT